MGSKSSVRLKSKDSQKVHLGNLLNAHTSFQVPRSIWSGVMRGTSSKNGKTRTKNHTFRAMKEWKGVGKLRLTKGTSKVTTECIYLISSSQLNLAWSYARNELKNRETWEKSTKKPLLWSCEELKLGWKVVTPPKGAYRMLIKYTYLISSS